MKCLHRSTQWSESVELLMNSDVSENVFLQTPKMQEFKRLFRQIAFRHQKISKIYDAETLICERVLEILTMSSYSHYDLNTKTVFNRRVHRKMEKQGAQFAGPSFCGVKMKIPENNNSS